MEQGDFILYRNAERNFEVISVRTSKRWEFVLEQALGAYSVFLVGRREEYYANCFSQLKRRSLVNLKHKVEENWY